MGQLDTSKSLKIFKKSVKTYMLKYFKHNVQKTVGANNV